MRYAARVTKYGNGRIAIQVPDVPGAITYGESEADALARAQRIVLLLIRQLMIDGLALPQPATSGDIWIEIPTEDLAAIEQYSARRPNQAGLRSLMSLLLAARKRELGEPAA